MGRSQDSFAKKEREKKKRKKKKEKAERREARKEDGLDTPEFMYVDAFGNLTATKPDPADKPKIKAEDIVLGIPPKEEGDDDPVKKGKVKFFNEEKGYGFINEDGGHQSYFVHVNNLIDEIHDGDKVEFETESGPKGPVAIKVKLAGKE